MKHRGFTFAMFVLLAGACGNRSLDFCDDPSCEFSSTEWARLSRLSPLPARPDDRSNRYRDTAAAIDLGRDFFSDSRFAGPATQVDALGRASVPARAPKGLATGVSCATCHDVGRGGADVTSVPGNVSAGAGWTDVNALPVVNSVYNRLWFRNGRADSGWALNIAVAESSTTMNGNRLHTVWVIADHYRDRYQAIFGPLPMGGDSSVPDPRFPLEGKPGTPAWDGMSPGDQEAIKRVLVNWAKAVDAYQSSLVSAETPFDVFMRQGPSSRAISAAAKRGARLFVGKASCVDCHSGPLLTDGEFHDVGVPQIGPLVPTLEDCPAGGPPGGTCDCASASPTNCLPFGAWDGLGKLVKNDYRRTSVFSDDPNDASRIEAAGDRTDALKGAWRTPGLRNVQLTAPYMHDGLYTTLAEVVAHYDRGGSAIAVGVRAPQVKPLGLSDREQSDLVAFLETLTEGPPATTMTPDAGSTPVAPGPPLVGIAALAAGFEHTCAVMKDGTARCWGANFNGQLGDGMTHYQPVPLPGPVPGLTGVTSIGAGHDFSCAALVDGSVRCWGSNANGQLGDAGGARSPLPVTVLGVSDTAAVAVGVTTACAALTTHGAGCWGSGPVGSLHFLATGVSSVAVGIMHVCATLLGGTVTCWGTNDYGQLGNPNGPGAVVIGLSGAVTIAAGNMHTCVALVDGSARCWGLNNYGQLGSGSRIDASVPDQVRGISGVVTVSAHYWNTCAVLADGTVRCWGWNATGQLGNGGTVDSSVPVQVAGLSGVVSVAVGYGHACALLGDGTARCWGQNNYGQLGDGTKTNSALLVPVLSRR